MNTFAMAECWQHPPTDCTHAVKVRVAACVSAIGAKAGGANILRATARVTFWGALAMALTAGIGALFGTVV